MSMKLTKVKHPIKDWGPSLTRQSELKSADINLIMAKFEKTGVLPPATREGFFADVSTVGDYRDALDRVKMADGYFLNLPPKIRAKFENDPAVFLDFVSDPANLPEIEELGLIVKEGEKVPPPEPSAAKPGSPEPDPVVEPSPGASDGDKK